MLEEKDIQIVHHPAGLAGNLSRAVFALGVFDGVHLGHQAVVSELLRLAEVYDAEPVVLYFEPFPLQVLCPEKAPLRLNTIEQKERNLRQLGIRHFVQVPFTHELARLTPDEFVSAFFTELPYQVMALCVGENWRFGVGNAGDVLCLKTLAESRGIAVSAVKPQEWNGTKISSSRIRQAVEAGRLDDAAAMMGRPFQLEGVVEKGLHLAGKKLDCPTVNVQNPELQLPPFGVYAARAIFGDNLKLFNGIMYIGDAPTVRGSFDHSAKLELHLFDFNEDVYGDKVTVMPVKFLRPSMKFDSLDALKNQISNDILTCKTILGICPNTG